MSKITETNLANVRPSPSADMLMERTKMTVRAPFAKVGLHRETWGPSAIVGVGAILSASVFPAVGVGLVSLMAGAPSWLAPVLATIVFVVYGVLALVMSDRNYKRAVLARADAEKRETASPRKGARGAIERKRRKGAKKKR